MLRPISMAPAATIMTTAFSPFGIRRNDVGLFAVLIGHCRFCSRRHRTSDPFAAVALSGALDFVAEVFARLSIKAKPRVGWIADRGRTKNQCLFLAGAFFLLLVRSFSGLGLGCLFLRRCFCFLARTGRFLFAGV